MVSWGDGYFMLDAVDSAEIETKYYQIYTTPNLDIQTLYSGRFSEKIPAYTSTLAYMCTIQAPNFEWEFVFVNLPPWPSRTQTLSVLKMSAVGIVHYTAAWQIFHYSQFANCNRQTYFPEQFLPLHYAST